VTAASSNGIRSDWIQSFTFVDGPAGWAPGMVQPPRSPSVSKDVSLTFEPAVTVTSSTIAPGTVVVPQSVANTIDSSTCLPL
jgi:hypothetical protein